MSEIDSAELSAKLPVRDEKKISTRNTRQIFTEELVHSPSVPFTMFTEQKKVYFFDGAFLAAFFLGALLFRWLCWLGLLRCLGLLCFLRLGCFFRALSSLLGGRLCLLWLSSHRRASWQPSLPSKKIGK